MGLSSDQSWITFFLEESVSEVGFIRDQEPIIKSESCPSLPLQINFDWVAALTRKYLYYKEVVMGILKCTKIIIYEGPKYAHWKFVFLWLLLYNFSV